MKELGEITLVAASVPRSGTFKEAAEVLRSTPASTIAVLNDDGSVAGLFGEGDLLRGLFPPYLAELHHTAFAEDDQGLLAERAHEVESQSIERYMREAVTLEADASAMHIAERFLHCDFGALPVLSGRRYIGMLSRADFCRAVLSKFGSDE